MKKSETLQSCRIYSLEGELFVQIVIATQLIVWHFSLDQGGGPTDIVITIITEMILQFSQVCLYSPVYFTRSQMSTIVYQL